MDLKTRIVIVLIISFGSITFFNHALMKKFQEDEARYQREFMNNKVTQKQAQEKASEIVKPADPIERKLTPSNPADYGIITLSSYDKPRSQGEWDVFVERVFEDQKVFESEEGKQAIEKMKIAPDKFANTVSRVDEEIKRFEKLKYEDPLNTHYEKRLEVLYKLKALSKVLEEKVVETPTAEGIASDSDYGSLDLDTAKFK